MTALVKKILSVHHVVFILIALCSGYLIFKNLGDAALWSDEAETAIIARNILKTGQFTGWDGRNLLDIPNVTEQNKKLIDYNAPMQFILTALSFSLFGENTFTARFAMAVIGLLTVILLYITLRRELPGHPAFALYATAFFGLFTDYVLYMRNCRYYSIACFAALLVFFAYRNYVRRCDMKSAVGLAAAAVLLYYSHFQICIAFLVPLAGIHLIFEKKRLPGKQWPQLLFACFLFALATLPYTAAFRLWERPDLPHVGSISDRITILSWYLEDSLGTGIAPWAVVTTALIMILFRIFDIQTRHIIKLALALLLGHIIFIGLSSLQSASIYYPIANIRYLEACFPFTAILAGGIFYRIHQKSRIIAPLVAALAISSNLSYINPWQNEKYIYKYATPHPLVFYPLVDYLYEIHHPFHTGIGSVVEFFNGNGKQDETYYAVPEYFNDPLQFYLGSKFINCCKLTENTGLGAQRARSLSPYLLKEENFPDWLVLFGRQMATQDAIHYFSRAIDSQGTAYNHVYELFKELPVNCRQANRPEIFLHHFGDYAAVVPEEAVMLFHKVTDDPAYWLLHFNQIIAGAHECGDLAFAKKVQKKLFGIYADYSAKLKSGNGHPEKPAADNSEKSDFQSNLGFICENDGKIDEAAGHYREALRLNPGNDKAYFNLANVLVRQGKLDEAIINYQEALRIDPKVATTHNNLGNTLAQRGQLDEAISHFEEALRLKPDLGDAQRNLQHALRIKKSQAK